jgi:anti-sigma factor RsiW
MTCAELVALVSEYLDGTLTPEQREVLESHAGDCRPCLVLIETTRTTIRLCQEAPGPGLDPERRQALVRRLERACREGHDEP